MFEVRTESGEDGREICLIRRFWGDNAKTKLKLHRIKAL